MWSTDKANIDSDDTIEFEDDNCQKNNMNCIVLTGITTFILSYAILSHVHDYNKKLVDVNSTECILIDKQHEFKYFRCKEPKDTKSGKKGEVNGSSTH